MTKSRACPRTTATSGSGSDRAECEWKLDAHSPTRSERVAQHVTGQIDGGGVWRVLRLGDDQAALEQLDRIVLVEEAEIEQAGVLLPRPPPRSDRHGRHCLKR